MEVNGVNYRNEEDYKARVLVPLLSSLGIHADDLEFEKSFSLKVGRSQETVDAESLWKAKSPRLDILVKNANKNAFILEVKSPNLDLTDDDRDQACCYAMLTYPRTPYAIVTNGKSSHIYRAYDLKELENDEIDLDSGFELVLPSLRDFDALSYFLRLSPRNLRKFCEAQFLKNIAALLGSETDLSKKYVPDLHLRNRDFEKTINDFLKSPKSVLALIGASGVGKTCSICCEAMARNQLEDYVIFFRGSELGASLKEAIAEEFSWTFSEEMSLPQLIKKVSSLVNDKPLIIFIDAIDEWAETTKQQQLGSLANQIAGLDVKLVVSCKSSDWNSFVERKGVETDLKSNLYQINGQECFVLGEPSTTTWYWMFRKYQNIFEFHGEWDPSLRRQAMKNLFLLRIGFTVAKLGQLSELKASSLEVYQMYLFEVVKKIDLEDIDTKALLTLLAKILYEQNIRSVNEIEFKERLGLSAINKLPKEIFSYGLLEIVTVNHQNEIRFVFEGLQNYITVYEHLRWQTLDSTALTSRLMPPWTSIQKELVHYYYGLANRPHKRALDAELFAACEQFLEVYKKLVSINFPALKEYFPQGDPSKVGFVIEADLETRKTYSYGIKKLGESDCRVTILPVLSRFSHALSEYGGHFMGQRFKANSILKLNPLRELTEFHLELTISKLIKDGNLNEYRTPVLAMELLNANVASNQSHQTAGLFKELAIRENMPLGELNHHILYQENKTYLERKLEDQMLRSGKIPYKETEHGISYSGPVLTHEQMEEIDKEAIHITDAGEKHNARVNPISETASRLLLAIDVIGIEKVLTPSLSTEYNLSYSFFKHATQVELKNLSERFLIQFFNTYQSIIEYNFPTLKHYFKLYEKMPIRCEVYYWPSKGGDAIGTLNLYLYSQSGGERNENIVSETHRLLEPSFEDIVEFEGLPYKLFNIHQYGLKNLLCGIHPANSSYPQIGQPTFSTAVRDLTYSWIEKEFQELVKNGALKSLPNT
jgi:hypothetical protein